MPRAKGGFDQGKYIADYMRENIKQVKVSLNRTNPEDVELIEFLRRRPEGASGYIKSLIRRTERMRPTIYPPTRYSDTLYGCGSCGHELAPGKPKFCHECGQAIDWTKEEGKKMTSKIGRYWYAVQNDREDDWGTGSYDLGEAKAMARKQLSEYPDTLIAVIDNTTNPDNPVCVEEITEF